MAVMRSGKPLPLVFSIALVSLSASACDDDDAAPGEAERASAGDLAIDIERCGAQDAEAIAAAMQTEINRDGTSTGTTRNRYGTFDYSGCRFAAGDGTRYEVKLAPATDESAGAWEAMRDDVPPAPDPEGGAPWAQGSGLAERVDALVTRDGEGLVARIGEDGYYFAYAPPNDDDEASGDDLSALAAVAAGVLAEPPESPHDFCRSVDDGAGEHFGETANTRGPSIGGSRLDGERYEFRRCRITLEDDALITAEVGDGDLFTGRAEAVDTSLPMPVEGLSLEALAYSSDVFVPLGDDLLLFSTMGVGSVDAEELVPFIEAALSD